MENYYIYIISLVLTILSLAVLSFYHIKFKPEWFSDDDAPEKERNIVRSNWKKYNIIGVILGLVFSIIALIGVNITGFEHFSLYYPAITSVVTFLAVVSWLTDTNFRLVDRKILRLSFIIIASFVIAFLIFDGARSQLYMVLIVLVFASLMFFVPAMGLSDARAVTIMFLAITPFLGGQGLILSITIATIVTIFYAIKKEGFKALHIKRKTSIPMVPLVLAPAAVTLSFGIYLPILLQALL